MGKTIKIIFGLFRLVIKLLLGHGKLKIHGFRYYIGKNVQFWISNKGICDIGKKTWFSDNCIIECNSGNIKLGYNNFFNTNCRLTAIESVTIGDNNLFGPNIVIVDHSHIYSDNTKLICKQGFKCIPVRIGSDVWICANVTICAGSNIGDHVIVSANSVVKGDLTIPGVYSGIPAKLVKKI